MRMNDPSVCHRLRPSHPPVKIILMNKKNSPHPTRASTHIRRYRRPPPPSDQIWEGGELPPLPLSPDLPPAGSRRDGNCRHRCRPSLASLRSDLGGRGTVAAAAALPGLPPAGSGRRGSPPAALPTSRRIWRREAPPPPLAPLPPSAGSGREGGSAQPVPRRCLPTPGLVRFLRSHHRC